ncbi:MAG: hypothetical protein ACP5P2_00320 [Candidatus Micrarchaeia archaeon]|jgi:hypothetical protein
MARKENGYALLRKIASRVPLFVIVFASGTAEGSSFLFDIVSTLSYTQELLMHIGPMLSALLFVVAGIFYAIGQILPPDKRANFHTASVNIILGAIVVAVLAVASNSLALASTQLLSNITANSIPIK